MKHKKLINRIAIILALIALVWGAKYSADDYVSSNSSTHALFTMDFQNYMAQNYNVNIDKTINEEGEKGVSDIEIRSVLSKYPELSKHFFDGIIPLENNPVTKYKSEDRGSIYNIEKVSPPIINTLSLAISVGLMIGSIIYIGVHALYRIGCLLVPGGKK